MKKIAQNTDPDGFVFREFLRNRTCGVNKKAKLNPVPSCPAKMLERVEVAKRSIEQDKERAKKQGREYRPVFSLIGFNETSVAIFERLACDANMERVWQTLAKIFDDTERQADTYAFANFCYQNIGIWEFSPKRTRAEHTRYFEQIADDLIDVVTRIVCEPEFGAMGQIGARVRCLEMVHDDALVWLMEQMDADPIDGRYIKSEEDAVGHLRFCLADIIPDLYSYAEWIATNARRIATQPSISNRPRRDSAQRTFFVKHLSKWFNDRFGKPMHEVVAGVASALFEEVVTADNVRKAVRSKPDVSIPFRRGKPPFPE